MGSNVGRRVQWWAMGADLEIVPHDYSLSSSKTSFPEKRVKECVNDLVMLFCWGAGLRDDYDLVFKGNPLRAQAHCRSRGGVSREPEPCARPCSAAPSLVQCQEPSGCTSADGSLPHHRLPLTVPGSPGITTAHGCWGSFYLTAIHLEAETGRKRWEKSLLPGETRGQGKGGPCAPWGSEVIPTDTTAV